MNIAILLASGKSHRAGRDKLLTQINGKELWQHSFETFANHKGIDKIILMVPKGKEKYFSSKIGLTKIKEVDVVAGGDTRMQSFINGINFLKKNGISFDAKDIILDHNAANPFVTASEISEVIKAAKIHGGAATSSKSVDTVMVENNGFYDSVIDREKIRLMQTPQAVRGDILQKVMDGELKKKKEATDLSSLILDFANVKVIEADPKNKKITFASDIASHSRNYFIGEDSHKFDTRGTLVIGGLKIAGLPKLKANSDGDVILHAIGRALAQANGVNFSLVADRICENKKNGIEIDSALFLKPFIEAITIHHISIAIECKTPHIDELPLAESIANIIGISKEQVSISAMSGEGLTPFGQGKAIRCTCIATITKNYNNK